MQSNKKYRSKAPGFADLLNYAASIENGIILNKDGSLMCGFYYRGDDLASSTAAERNSVSARANAAFARLGSGWMIHVDAVRIESVGYPKPEASHFPDRVTRWIDEERRRQFAAHETHYESIYALIVTYLPPLRTQSQIADFMFTDAKEDGKIKRRSVADKAIDYFKGAVGEMQDSLSSIVEIEPMLDAEAFDGEARRIVRSELLRYINFSITGISHPINLPPIPMYLDALVGGQEFFTGITPKIGDKFVAVVGIDGFPTEGSPGMLAALDTLQTQYRWSTRFIFLDPEAAKGALGKFRRKWAQKQRGFVSQIFNTNRGPINQDAVDMTQEVDDNLSMVERGEITYGYYTANVIFLDADRTRLEENAKTARTLIQNLGFAARMETINTVEAWLGSLPGHGTQNIRRPLLHTLNLVDLLPLQAIWPGREYCPCPFYPPKSPPLLHAVADGATPFRMNLHVGDLGHTLVFGPTGSGKSVLLATIVAQFRRYHNARIFCFDKSRSLFTLTHACGGTHYDIASENAAAPSFCPLQHIDNSADLVWAEEWIGALLTIQGIAVLPPQRNLIHDAMLALRNAPPEARTLTDFSTNLQDVNMREALKPYTLDGSMGKLLDSKTDSLRDSRFQTFEIEELMNLGNKNMLPVVLYLFHAIERALDGNPTLIVIDEAWIVLGHPVFRDKIKEWLKMLRKANAIVLMATQSLSDAQNSGILDVLVESCPTKIYLPNGKALSRGTGSQMGPFELYQLMQLNERQIEMLSTATPKREYYFVSDEGRRLFRLNLGPLALAFVATSSKGDIAKVRRLMSEHPDTWPVEWLRDRDVDPTPYLT
jgi:type IV secretion system protein VirB4